MCRDRKIDPIKLEARSATAAPYKTTENQGIMPNSERRVCSGCMYTVTYVNPTAVHTTLRFNDLYEKALAAGPEVS
jgi:hypothetical protein